MRACTRWPARLRAFAGAENNYHYLRSLSPPLVIPHLAISDHGRTERLVHRRRGSMQSKQTTGRANYRKRALEHYHDRLHCWYCGFGFSQILEVAHLDGRRQNNAVANLAMLCPTCQKMLDLGLISKGIVLAMRDRSRIGQWSKRMKDAGKKAAETRKRNGAALRRKRHLAAVRAAKTRKRNRPATR